MNKFIATISILVLTFSQIASADCPSYQTELSDGTCVNLNEGNSSSNGAMVLVGVAAVGYGIYKMASSGDTPQEANLRAKEISDGFGIRLNNINAPIRISTMRPFSYTAFGKAQEEDENQSGVNLSMLHIEYNW